MKLLTLQLISQFLVIYLCIKAIVESGLPSYHYRAAWIVSHYSTLMLASVDYW